MHIINKFKLNKPEKVNEQQHEQQNNSRIKPSNKF